MRYTITDLRKDFPNDDACLEWLKDYIYPEGIYCPIDKKITPHHRMRTRKSYSCELCGHHVHPTADTIFHKSSTPLTLWFYAIYLMAQTRAGISAKQLERELGVTYKTAWRMFHQIRKMMGDDDKNLSGTVEVDEAYIGGQGHWRAKKRYDTEDRKQVVIGMVERKGRVKATHVKSSGARALLPQIQKNIELDTQIYSDEYGAYKTLPRLGYKHGVIRHQSKQFVKGDIHTQTIENFWSNMKRGIRGVYRHVDPKYLQSYVDEYAFRYSHRQHPSMFWALAGRIQKV